MVDERTILNEQAIRYFRASTDTERRAIDRYMLKRYDAEKWRAALAECAGTPKAGVDLMHADRNNCPVIVGQQRGIGPGLFLVCNRPLPCTEHGGTPNNEDAP